MIEDALRRADAEPLDRQPTTGTPGGRYADTTSTSQIPTADAFIADVSFIAKNETRSVISPEVGIELGIATTTFGRERVLLTFDQNSGPSTDLPQTVYDYPVLSYSAAVGGGDYEQQTRRLSDALHRHLKLLPDMPARPVDAARRPRLVPTLTNRQVEVRNLGGGPAFTVSATFQGNGRFIIIAEPNKLATDRLDPNESLHSNFGVSAGSQPPTIELHYEDQNRSNYRETFPLPC